LARRPSRVGELAQGLPVSRPAVSQHLKVLRDAGLVTAPEGGSRVYRIDPDALAGMRAYLDRFWSDALAAFEDPARAEEGR
jgi:DNA-binding transcriptional ArsR family regulator